MDAVITLCECGCGQQTPIAKKTRSKDGHVKGQPVRFVQGHNSTSTQHGLKSSPEYQAYMDARYRCTNPSVGARMWARYGGRGIKFLFTSFQQWYAELGPRPSPKHSVDRKDNDGHYEIGNVRWATKSEQRINQRQRKKAA